MKVLLVYPPYADVYSKVKGAEGISPPLGLAYLAAYLRENGIEVNILDTNALRMTYEAIGKALEGYEIIGVTSNTPFLHSALEILRIAKKINHNCRTVMGGFHLSALPIETLYEHPQIDFGVIGEGEAPFLKLIQGIENNGDYCALEGIVFRNNGKVIFNPPGKLFDNLDGLPFPAYDLLPLDKYIQPLHHLDLSKNNPISRYMILATSRGCAYDCGFCASKVIWRRQVRYRSAENILAEIKLLVEKYKIKVFDIGDDHFLQNKERAHLLLDKIIEASYGISFCCSSRVDIIDEEILYKLKRAGCYLIRYGVESGSPELLRRMQKNITVEQIRRAFNLTRRVGLTASATFIIGYPGETQETFNETINLAKSIKPHLVSFFIAIPFPGTELYNIVHNNLCSIDNDYSHWGLFTRMPPVSGYNFSPEELIRLRNKAYREFYLRLPFIIERLKDIKSINYLKFYLLGLKGLLKLAL